MDEIMKGQLERLRHYKWRMGYSESQIEQLVTDEKIRLEGLKPNVGHNRPFTNKYDPTFGKFPWLPLCDI